MAIEYFMGLILCRFTYCWLFSQFVANEHKQIFNNVDTAPIIEPDGPSTISRDDDDSKVIFNLVKSIMASKALSFNWHVYVCHLQCTSPGEGNDEEATIGQDKREEDAMENYKVRLRKELVSRDGHSEIDKDTTIFLTFKDKNLEAAYVEYREPFSSIPLTASLLVQIVGVVYSLFVLPRYVTSY